MINFLSTHQPITQSKTNGEWTCCDKYRSSCKKVMFY